MNKLHVFYSCFLCGMHRIGLDVDPREPDEDVRVWFDKTLLKIQGDHFTRSPDCQATKLDEVLIPVAGAPRIGEVPQH